MSEVVAFDFNGQDVRVATFHGVDVRIVMINGDPWWVVNDVCAVLDIGSGRRAVDRLDEQDVTLTNVLDGRGIEQQTWVVNESGLYELIFRSNKPQAKTFRRWVTSEVLPQIRQTGTYSVQPMSTLDMLEQQIAIMRQQEHRTAALEARVDSIEQNTGWYTALGYAKREALPTNHRYLNRLGHATARITRAAGDEPSKVRNELWGEVNSYPEWALSEAAGGLAQ